MEIAQRIKDEAAALGTYAVMKHNLDAGTMMVIANAPIGFYAWIQHRSPIGTIEVHTFEDQTFAHFAEIESAWENVCEASFDRENERKASGEYAGAYRAPGTDERGYTDFGDGVYRKR